MRWSRAARCAVALAIAVAACGGEDEDARDDASFVVDIRAAVAAVESERGGPQDYFEVTATTQLTNVFVAVDGATAAVPYVYVDGELQVPGPRIDGATGQTFAADAIDFDEQRVLSGVRADLPDATIDALSVEGGPGGFVRYVISARSRQGGVLDIVVTGAGAVVEVNAL